MSERAQVAALLLVFILAALGVVAATLWDRPYPGVACCLVALLIGLSAAAQ